MAGIMEALFGPDGVGGQPGLVGKAGQAIWQGTGELSPNAGFGETVAKSLGNIPHFLTDIAIKNPLEILRNPASALNDRGEVSITRLLFPDFRRNAEKEQKQQQKLQDAATSAQVFNTYNNLVSKFTEAPQEQRGGIANLATQAGIPDQQIEQALAAANQQDQSRQQAIGAVTPAVANVPGGAELVRMLFSQDPNQKAAGELLWKKQQEDARLAAREQAKAERAAARNTPKPTDAEKAVDAFNRALASGDPLLIAATRAEVEKLGKSSQPMVVTGPSGTVVGPAGDVVPFASATRRDEALATMDTADATMNVIGQLRDIAIKSPEAFGAAGATMRFKQGLLGQLSAFTAIQNKAFDDISTGKVDPDTAKKLLENFSPEAFQADSLLYTLAYAKARLNNPTGVLTDRDFEQAYRQVGASGPLTTSQSILTNLDLIEKDALAKRKRAKLRAGLDRKPTKTSIQQALDRAQGIPSQPEETAAPKNGKLGKKKSQKPVGDYMGEMPDFSQMSDEQLRALSGQ